jgi:hypothetical protein
MAIDPAQIELTREQKRLLALKAEREGVDYATMLDEWLGATLPQSEGANRTRGPSVLERMKAHGAVGCVVGPGDLTTNPKHMEGFGTNARRPGAD